MEKERRGGICRFILKDRTWRREKIKSPENKVKLIVQTPLGRRH